MNIADKSPPRPNTGSGRPEAELPQDTGRTGGKPDGKPGEKTSRRPLSVLLGICIALLLVAGTYELIKRARAPVTNSRNAQAAIQPVGAATIGRQDIRVMLDALGTVTPLATVTVRTQINGQLTEVAFHEGDNVKKGDFLAQIDSRPYQAALQQAQGQLAHDQGLLDQARRDLVRYQNLAKTNAIPQQQTEDQAFLVKQDEGSVETDQAQIRTQNLNITYCHIVSPVDGRVGLRLVDPGARYVENGLDPLEAARQGSQQIGFTIVSLTVSLVAVLIPLLFMGEVVGRLFHEFAITLAVAIVTSAFVALTLVPMLCAKLIRHRPRSERSRFDIAAERIINGTIARYGRALNVVLAHQPLTLAVALATLGLTVVLYILIPKGFFPVQDTGMIQAISEAPQSASFAEMARLQTELSDTILADRDVESLSSFIGVDGTNPTVNTGRFLINLKPLHQRSLDASEIIRRLNQEVSKIVGVKLYMQPVQDLTIDATVTRAQYKFVLENPNPSEFQSWVPKLVQRLAALPELADVASDLQQRGLAVDLVIDRATAGRFGITPATIDNALYDLFGQRIISTVYTQSNQYRVILESDPTLQSSLAALSSIYLPSSSSTTSGQVPLSAIVHVETRTGPLVVTHYGQFPATTVSFNLAPNASLGAAIDAIERVKSDIGLPDSFALAYQGAAAAFQSALTNELFLIAAAVATMYIVLGVLYESFIHPITILSTLPSAGVGALLSLMVVGHELDIIAIIGIILLIGIVKKNGIILIDFALEAERVHGRSPREAIYEACLLRFRPILMTTLAAMLGALPLMLATGAGAELRRPLGIAIVGGLLVSQLLTLFTTPVIYLYFDRLAIALSGRAPNRLAGGTAQR